MHRQIAQYQCQHLWLVGGSELASQFLRQGLIDQIVVSVMPIVLGQGIPLFSDLSEAMVLSQVGVVSRAQGIVELTYVPDQE